MKKERSVSVGESKHLPMADSLTIDLGSLCAMHPRLPGDIAAIMVVRAALGLQRNKHASGTDLQVFIDNASLRSVLAWPTTNLRTAKQHDNNQITEDGAEAIALAVAHKSRTWRVVRRLQREEHADWLLEYQENCGRELVAFEVSGVDRGSTAVRLKEKMARVSKSVDVDQRWAGVVGFQQPEAVLQSVEVRTNGR